MSERIWKRVRIGTPVRIRGTGQRAKVSCILSQSFVLVRKTTQRGKYHWSLIYNVAEDLERLDSPPARA